MPERRAAPARALVALGAAGVAYQLASPLLAEPLLALLRRLSLAVDPDYDAARLAEQTALDFDWGGMLARLAIAALVLAGGLHMRAARSYGAALAGAALAVLPCFGPCFGLGLPIGVWALVVLCDADVRRAFARS